MEDMNIRMIAALFLVLLIVSLGGHLWQFHTHRNATSQYREAVSELRTEISTRESEIEMYLAYIQDLEERITPDMVLQEQQRDTIRRFINSYFTFDAGEEETRIDNSAEFVVDEMLEIMREALAENPGGNYHLSLEASNISVYTGRVNEFLATFNVTYESDITRSMTQILVISFTMTDEQIKDFAIISANEVFNFD